MFGLAPLLSPLPTNEPQDVTKKSSYYWRESRSPETARLPYGWKPYLAQRRWSQKGETIDRMLAQANNYAGQTTNFRTPGGGFAPVVVVP